MPTAAQAHATLQACMVAAKNDPVKMAACETAFKDAGVGGTVTGGKVFSTPDGQGTSVINGGKVFRGGQLIRA